MVKKKIMSRGRQKERNWKKGKEEKKKAKRKTSNFKEGKRSSESVSTRK